MGSHVRLSGQDDDKPPQERDPGEAPETPPDEPRPPRRQDPLPEPTPKGPYTVTGAQPSTVEWRVEP